MSLRRGFLVIWVVEKAHSRTDKEEGRVKAYGINISAGIHSREVRFGRQAAPNSSKSTSEVSTACCYGRVGWLFAAEKTTGLATSPAVSEVTAALRHAVFPRHHHLAGALMGAGKC